MVSTTPPIKPVKPPRLPAQCPPAIRHSDRPLPVPASTGNPSAEPKPKTGRAADEMKRVFMSRVAQVGPIVSWLLHETRNVAVATWEQGVRIVRYAVARSELSTASRREEDARFAYGRKLYEAGTGDPEVIKQVAELTLQIDDKEAPSEVREKLDRRRKELTVRLSRSGEPSSSNLPSNGMAEHSEVIAAAGTHENRLAVCDSTKAALWPHNAKERRQVLVGVAGSFAVIMIVGLWTISRFGDGDSDSQNVLATIDLPSPPKPSTDIIVPGLARANSRAEEKPADPRSAFKVVVARIRENARNPDRILYHLSISRTGAEIHGGKWLRYETYYHVVDSRVVKRDGRYVGTIVIGKKRHNYIDPKDDDQSLDGHGPDIWFQSENAAMRATRFMKSTRTNRRQKDYEWRDGKWIANGGSFLRPFGDEIAELWGFKHVGHNTYIDDVRGVKKTY